MSKLIKSFEDIESAAIARLADDKIGGETLPNTDIYKKPRPVSGYIDVVNRFTWFSSGMSNATAAAMAKVPKLMLVEKEQVLNSQLSQALYYINSIAKAGSNIANSQVVSKFTEFMGVDGKTQTAALDKINKFKNYLKSKSASKSTTKRLEGNFLRSLIGIYLTEDTGFNYCLPYFEKPPSISNSWGAPNNESVASGIINTGMDVVEEISSFVNLAQPGVYIQKAKHFSFSEEGPSLTVKFPLFNTVSRNQGDIAYQLNYEFLWLLTYQNKPYKTSFARTLPPKIYDATISGMMNMPYAYISNLEVNFVGTVRNKEVEIADIGRFTAPIPDAYEVTIEFTSLLSDYANLMVGTGFHGNTVGNTVTVGKAPAQDKIAAISQDPSEGFIPLKDSEGNPSAENFKPTLVAGPSTNPPRGAANIAGAGSNPVAATRNSGNSSRGATNPAGNGGNPLSSVRNSGRRGGTTRR